MGQKLPDVLTREGATTLVDLVVKAGLAETLNGDGPFTIFAPTNEAFEKLPQSDLEQLLANPEALKKVLLYHVIPAEIKSSDIELDDVLVASAEGAKLRVNTYMKKFYYDVSLCTCPYEKSKNPVQCVKMSGLPFKSDLKKNTPPDLVKKTQ